ncbi:MAG: hypothetical protein IJ398_03305 [Clostridia bacterium]|nr:hypothetical protein [Clostridia bacterium]
MTEALIFFLIFVGFIVLSWLINSFRTEYVKKEKRCPRCGGKYKTRTLYRHKKGRIEGEPGRKRDFWAYGESKSYHEILVCENCGKELDPPPKQGSLYDDVPDKK